MRFNSYFKKLFLFFAITVAALPLCAQKQYVSFSPDKKIKLIVSVTDSIRYELLYNQGQLISPSTVSLKTDFLKNKPFKISNTETKSVNQILSPVVRQKNKTIKDQYNELQLYSKEKIALIWRVYNNGIAWRWVVKDNRDYKIIKEIASFGFQNTDTSWYPLEDSFYSHNERTYKNLPLSEIGQNQLASLPALFSVKNGVKLLITESDLFNYAGMWIKGDGKGKISGVFPHYPKQKEITSDRDEKILSREDFIAKCNHPQEFPWRIIMIAPNDADLLSNQLVYQLASPSKGDFSWVQPGKVSWDWWNANNIFHVDFKAGINNDTYKYYIDFAAKYGLKYIVLDEGWSDTKDLLKTVPDINVQELCDYGKGKGVGVILWTTWLTLDQQLDKALDQFEKWGIKGIKVDFMQRDDQNMVNFYERVAKAAVQKKMLVDFHGAYKPTGMYRTYPNVITSEGVFGLENSKWDPQKRISPDHNVTLPFIRMVAGPMDYTPGAMLNAQKDSWAPIFNCPMSLGTRCHQLAMYVVFESPLEMLADSPTHYYAEPECMKFLKSVPSVWDTTIPLQAKVGEYVVIARKAANDNWYIGGMTNWTERDLNLNLSFLSSGKYNIQIWQDGINADRNAQDFKVIRSAVDNTSSLKVHLAPGGGVAAIISPEK